MRALLLARYFSGPVRLFFKIPFSVCLGAPSIPFRQTRAHCGGGRRVRKCHRRRARAALSTAAPHESRRRRRRRRIILFRPLPPSLPPSPPARPLLPSPPAPLSVLSRPKSPVRPRPRPSASAEACIFIGAFIGRSSHLEWNAVIRSLMDPVVYSLASCEHVCPNETY